MEVRVIETKDTAIKLAKRKRKTAAEIGASI